MTASITFELRPKGEGRTDDIGRNTHRKVSLDGVHVFDLKSETAYQKFYKAWHVKNLPEDGPQTPFWIRRLKLTGRDFFTLAEARRLIEQEIQRAIAAGENEHDWVEVEDRLRVQQSEWERQRKVLRGQLDFVETKLSELAWLD